MNLSPTQVAPVRIVTSIRTVSEANQPCHWGTKARRVKQQRKDAAVYLFIHRQVIPPAPVTVTLVRVSPRGRALDTDNLASSMKAVRDEVARHYGIDDGSPLFQWVYAQERGPAGVRIEFAERSAEA